MIFLDEMYKDVFIDDQLKGQVFVDEEIRDEKNDYFESTDIFKELFGLNEEVEHHYLRLISQSDSPEYISQTIKTPEERFYILFIVLRNNVTNKNLKEGLSGVTMQYHKYYKMYQPENTKNVFMTEPAVPKRSRISNEIKEEIGVSNGFDDDTNDTSYNTSKYIIQRDDFAYEKIHLFKKHEFSNNIAYEFAKRSRYPLAELEDIHILKHTILEIFGRNNSENKPLDNNRLDLIHKIIKDDNNFCALFNFFIDKNLNIKFLYDDFFHLPTIHKYKYYNEYQDYFKEILQYHELIFENYFLNNSQNNHSVFLPRYKSPILNETILFSNDYRINISLPEDELIDYVKQLKKDFKKSIEQESINILELMFGYKDQYNDEVASMLFIYDSIRVGFKYEHIAHSLSDFDGKNVESKININTPLDKKTIKKYFAYSKLLIEEEYYRSLVTPIYDEHKIKDLKDKIQKIKKSNT